MVGSYSLLGSHTIYPQRPTNHLDTVPVQEPGNKGFTRLHGHHGLLVHELLSWPTMKDTYHPPHRALLLGRGEAEPCLSHVHPQNATRSYLQS